MEIPTAAFKGVSVFVFSGLDTLFLDCTSTWDMILVGSTECLPNLYLYGKQIDEKVHCHY